MLIITKQLLIKFNLEKNKQINIFKDFVLLNKIVDALNLCNTINVFYKFHQNPF